MGDSKKVVNLVDFDNVKPEDTRGGIMAYSLAARQINKLESVIAKWQFSAMYYIWIKNDMMPTPTALAFEIQMELEVAFITSEAAGASRLTKKEASLSGRCALADAYKKLMNGLEKGLDFDKFTNCSKITVECSRLNKIATDAENSAKTKSEISNVACLMADNKNLAEGTPEREKFVNEKIAELTKKVMKANSPAASEPAADGAATSGSAPVAELPTWYQSTVLTMSPEIKSQAQLVIDSMAELTEQAIKLFIEKSLIMNGDTPAEKAAAAATQVIEGIVARRKKWQEAALAHHTIALGKGLVTDDEEDDAASAVA